MASIEDKAKNPKPSRADYRLPSDGPHRYVKKEVATEKEKNEAPPYVIAVTKREKDDEKSATHPPISKYDPEEMRVKAKTFLKSPNITGDQKSVLKDILGPDEEPTPT